MNVQNPLPNVDAQEIRDEIARVANEVEHVARRRAERLSVRSQVGVRSARETIAEYPMTSMLAATLAGVVAGAVLTGGRHHQPRTWSDDLGNRAARLQSDLSDHAAHLQASLGRAAKRASTFDYLEDLSNSLRHADVRKNLSPLLAGLTSMFGNAKDAATDVAEKVSDKVSRSG